MDGWDVLGMYGNVEGSAFLAVQIASAICCRAVSSYEAQLISIGSDTANENDTQLSSRTFLQQSGIKTLKIVPIFEKPQGLHERSSKRPKL